MNAVTELGGATQGSTVATEQQGLFAARHIGPDEADQKLMLKELGFASREALMDAVVPAGIRLKKAMSLGAFTRPRTEQQALAELRALAEKNQVFKSFIGQGYFGTYTPGVIQRNVFENPAWYTSYTPYQPEISQGRLEALVNFQQMVADLTALDIANASLLDEASAAAEAMTLVKRAGKSESDLFFVADDVLPQTIEVVQTRARSLGFRVVTGKAEDAVNSGCFGAL
ncbi:MAG: glycine dehydrogenase (aminomethyl-transferring), partial [Gammaproteobacteria bacterium]|nr:glycine dehydrogenase (aminomethyl-transferring) [Gammaproteobacteria bacterium]